MSAVSVEESVLRDPIFGKRKLPHGMRIFFEENQLRPGAFSPLLINIFTALPIPALLLLAKLCHRF